RGEVGGRGDERKGKFFPDISGDTWLDNPVMFPPGDPRLSTILNPIGSKTLTITIGIVLVASFAATALFVPEATISLTLSRTSSAASSYDRAITPSAKRRSIAMFSPSTKPCSRSPSRNDFPTGSVEIVGSFAKKPIRRRFAPCCARTVSGHATAPPSSVMNWRRLLIRSPRRRRPAACPAREAGGFLQSER